MKYVITGGAGFIGSNLVDRLINSNHEVHVIDDFSTGKRDNCNKMAQYHKINVSDQSQYNDIVKVLKGSDVVFHMACKARVQPSIVNPVDYEINNTIGTSIILKASVDSKVRRVVYSSSSSVYGDSEELPLEESFVSKPLSPYAAQKRYGEILCQTFHEVYKIETVSLRYFNVYGERQNLDGAYALVIGIFLNQNKNNQPLTIRGNGEQKRDFTYVGDVVDANILAANSYNVGKGEIINIGYGNNRSINQIANIIGGEKLYIEPILEPFETLANNNKAKKKLKWKPSMDIESWLNNYLNIKRKT